VDAGIESAHVSVLDPNPLVDGRGVDYLREHGIEVSVGESADEACELIEEHMTLIGSRRPLVTMLLDPPEHVAESELRISDLVLDPTRRTEEDVAVFLERLAERGIARVAVMAGSASAHDLLGSGLVDRILAGPGASPPHGFILSESSLEPVRHSIFRRAPESRSPTRP
jgi:hypothetical protein